MPVSRIAKDKRDQSSLVSVVVLASLVVSSAVIVDPLGFQAFLSLRYATTLVFLLGAVVLTWKGGISLPRQRIVRVAIPCLLIALLLSALASRAPVVALLGAAGRQLGWIGWTLFAVAFVVGLSSFAPSEVHRVELTLIVGFAGAILGVGFISGLELLGMPIVEVNQTFGSRLQASFGNPAVLGAFLALGLPVVVGGLAARRLPVLTAGAAVVGAGLLILSGTRGAWIGLVVGTAFAGVAMAFRRRRVAAVAVAVAATTAVIVILVASSISTGRWETAVSGFEGRAATWGVAATIVREHAELGVGPEGFATAFAEAVDDDYVIRYTRDDVADRAHNGMLDVATIVGVPGLLAYLALVAGTLWVAWKAANFGDRLNPTVIGAAAGVVAYIVQQQALFQLAVLDITFWLVVGLLSAVVGFGTDRSSMPVATIALGAFTAAALVYSVVGVYADHEDRAALESGNANQAMSRLERAATLRPSDDIHAFLAGDLAAEVGTAWANARAGALVDAALNIDSTSSALTLQRAALLSDAFELSGSAGALDAARMDLEQLVVRDRTNGDAFLRLGAIAFRLGDYQTARAHWTRAAYLMPHRSEPIDNLGVLSRRE